MKDLTLVIMAAGMGSRFGGLKQIEPIDEHGEFIIDYSIYDAIRCGFNKVVFIIKRENYDLFEDTIGKRIKKHIKVEYAFQEMDKYLPIEVPKNRIKPWGTGHAILCAKDKVKENFAIINADDFYGREAFLVISKFLKENNYNEYALAGYQVGNTLTNNGSVKRGVCKVVNGYLSGMIESSIEREEEEIVATPLDGSDKILLQEDSPVSTNLFGFTPYLFDYLEKGFTNYIKSNINNILSCECLIQDIVFNQVKDKDATVKVLPNNAIWQGVTYKEDKENVVNGIKALVNKGEYPNNLWN